MEILSNILPEAEPTVINQNCRPNGHYLGESSTRTLVRHRLLLPLDFLPWLPSLADCFRWRQFLSEKLQWKHSYSDDKAKCHISSFVMCTFCIFYFNKTRIHVQAASQSFGLRLEDSNHEVRWCNVEVVMWWCEAFSRAGNPADRIEKCLMQIQF